MKKLMLGLMMAFAVNVARAEEISGVMIDGLTYDLDTETKTAKITGYASSPQVVDVSTVKHENATYAVTAVADGVFWAVPR